MGQYRLGEAAKFPFGVHPHMLRHAKMVTVTLALPDVMMAEVEALVDLTDPPQRRTAVLQYLLSEGLQILKCGTCADD